MITYGVLPWAGDAVHIRSFMIALEALRSPKVHKAKLPGETTSREGTISWMDGPAHLSQRRALNRVVSRDAHRRYTKDVVVPTVRRHLHEVLGSPDADGTPRTDLVPFGQRVFFELGVVLTGLDVDTQEGRDSFSQALARSGVASQRLRDTFEIDPSGPHAIAPEELEAMAQESELNRAQAGEVLRDAFFRPSLERRKKLLARVAAGEIDEADLPIDAVMLVAMKAHPSFETEDVALKQVTNFLVGSTNTNLAPLSQAMHELEGWFDRHAEDRRLATDPEFLAGAMNEVFRLYPIFKHLYRVAVDDLTLSDGTHIRQGQVIAVDLNTVNQDPEVFGDDAASFDPRRRVREGGYPYGLGFASGPHMCMGLPIVIGSQGIDGTHVHILQNLFEAGIHRDGEPVYGPRDRVFSSYPVAFRAAVPA